MPDHDLAQAEAELRIALGDTGYNEHQPLQKNIKFLGDALTVMTAMFKAASTELAASNKRWSVLISEYEALAEQCQDEPGDVEVLQWLQRVILKCEEEGLV